MCPPENVIHEGYSEAPGRFIHPMTGREYLMSPNMTDGERLRLLCDVSDLNPYDQAVFSALFPDDLGKSEFNEQSIQFAPETAMTPEERAARRHIMQHFGFTSRAKKDETGEIRFQEEDVPDLYVGFTEDPASLAGILNRLPGVKRLDSIAQTEVDTFVTRAEHTKHLAREVLQTNIRLAMQQPDLYMQRIAMDMAVYTKLFTIERGPAHRFVLEPSEESMRIARQVMDHFSGTSDDAQNIQKLQALGQAIEYSKYLVTAAYLHDVFTPGWGDMFMKTRARGPRQVTVNYSEDKALADSIFPMLESTNDYSGLRHLVSTHEMNGRLLGTMVRSMASEGDVCLGGQLMKAKYKLKNMPSEFQEFFSFLPRQQRFDLDQISGTIANTDPRKESILGGLRHIKRNSDLPIGSFEDRARLYAYARAKGFDNADMKRMLIDVGIKQPERVFIAAEEIAIGANLVLREVEFNSHKDIQLVSVQPGDVKRAILMFNINQIWHYRSPRLAAAEALTQTFIASALYAQGKERPLIDPDIFINGDDFTVQHVLNERLPIVTIIFNELAREARIVTRDELLSLCNEFGELPNCLVIHDGVPGLVVEKEGTLVETDDKQILPYGAVVRTKRADRLAGSTEVHRDSLIARLNAVKAVLATEDLYMIVPVSRVYQEELDVYFHNVPGQDQAEKNRIRTVMLTALDIWMKDIVVDEQHVVQPLMQNFLDGLRKTYGIPHHYG